MIAAEDTPSPKIDVEKIRAMGVKQTTQKPAYPAVILITTTNAPSRIIRNHLIDVDKATSETANAQTLQLYLGFDPSLENVFDEIRKSVVDDKNATAAGIIERRLNVGFDPSWFKALAAAKAPVTALAECRGEIDPNTCKILVKATGDLPLDAFLEMATERQVPYARQLLKPFLETEDESE
jgi:hypothetical protein